MSRYDLLVKGGTAVLPCRGEIRADPAVSAGKVAAFAHDVAVVAADEVIDARGKTVLPGAVDAHFHLGI
ncbi:hypothetical protein [Streptosporangium amethystogenes]|uniref:hypothetical protein n=1 Tax=Streptosporangium amethystogenes TaxID=2002 RepID=UPI0004C4C529|nr:hypothetical protein [Streptosporangium amethystogenes]